MFFLENYHFIKGLDPIADAFSGTVYTDIVSFKNYQSFLFLAHIGVGATGTSTLTVQACDDFSGSNVSAVPFYYREILSGDTEGTLTAATTAGFTVTAGSSKIVVIEVEAEACISSGYDKIRLKAVESVDSPVLGGIAIIGKPIITKSAMLTAIA